MTCKSKRGRQKGLSLMCSENESAEIGSNQNQSVAFLKTRRLNLGIIDWGVPQAYVRTRASSATLCSVHVSRVFLCIFYIWKGIWYVSKRAWIHIWYVSKPLPPPSRYPLMIILKIGTNRKKTAKSEQIEVTPFFSRPPNGGLQVKVCLKVCLDQSSARLGGGARTSQGFVTSLVVLPGKHQG